MCVTYIQTLNTYIFYICIYFLISQHLGVIEGDHGDHGERAWLLWIRSTYERSLLGRAVDSLGADLCDGYRRGRPPEGGQHVRSAAVSRAH